MTEAERAMRAAQVQAKKMNVTLEMLNSPALVIMTNRGYIKRIDPAVFSKQGRATRGRNMGKMRGGDEVTKVMGKVASFYTAPAETTAAQNLPIQTETKTRSVQKNEAQEEDRTENLQNLLVYD